jgi:FixJ family two-component response regulator
VLKGWAETILALLKNDRMHACASPAVVISYDNHCPLPGDGYTVFYWGYPLRERFHPSYLYASDMSDPIDPTSSIFIIDDDQHLLDSLISFFSGREFLVHAFSSARSFRQFYRPEMPGCLVLDTRIPRENGLDFYRQLLREGKRLPVIFISADADVSTIVAAMKTGAIEFLEKPVNYDTLLDRVQKALALDAQWRRRDAAYAALAQRIEQLSSRDRETLELIQAGVSNKSMASKLFLTERAVEMRRAAIMKKLQVNSVAELLDLTITHRILTELRQESRTRTLQP